VLLCQEEEGPYDEGIGMNAWNGKHDGFRTREEEHAWMEQERAFFDAVSPALMPARADAPASARCSHGGARGGQADKDGDGGLTMDEYKAAMIEDMLRYYEEEGKERKLTAEDDAHVQEMADHFRDEDLNGDGKISITEWVALAFHEDAQEARYRDGHAEHELTEADLAEHRAEAEREFALFDKDGDGRLTLEEAMELVRGDTEIGVGEDKVEEEELREMTGEVLAEMDRDADGAVTKEEFVRAHGPDVPPRPPPPLPPPAPPLPRPPPAACRARGSGERRGAAQASDPGAVARPRSRRVSKRAAPPGAQDPQGAEADARLMRAEQWANTKRAMELQDVGYEHPSPPPPPCRTNWTRLVPPPVLSGHVSSLPPY